MVSTRRKKSSQRVLPLQNSTNQRRDDTASNTASNKRSVAAAKNDDDDSIGDDIGARLQALGANKKYQHESDQSDASSVVHCNAMPNIGPCQART